VAFEKLTLEKETPTASFGDGVFGFYAVIGDSVVKCKDDLSKEFDGDFSQSIRQKYPDRPIILSEITSHMIFHHIDDTVDRLNITRVVLPRCSPNFNPIEQICRRVKRELSPLDTLDLDTYRSRICDVFHNYADRFSFIQARIDTPYQSRSYDYY